MKNYQKVSNSTMSTEHSDPDDNRGFSFSVQVQVCLQTCMFTTGRHGMRTATRETALTKAITCSLTEGRSPTTTEGGGGISSTSFTPLVGLLQTLLAFPLPFLKI